MMSIYAALFVVKKPHAGIDAKRRWLSDRLNEGHVFRKLDAKATVFIEYAPLETAWVPINGDNYLYLYCLWVTGSYKGKGYGKALMEYCLDDAKEKGKSGICMLGGEKNKKSWLSNQAFSKEISASKLSILPTMDTSCLLFFGWDNCQDFASKRQNPLESKAKS